MSNKIIENNFNLKVQYNYRKFIINLKENNFLELTKIVSNKFLLNKEIKYNYYYIDNYNDTIFIEDQKDFNCFIKSDIDNKQIFITNSEIIENNYNLSNTFDNICCCNKQKKYCKKCFNNKYLNLSEDNRLIFDMLDYKIHTLLLNNSEKYISANNILKESLLSSKINTHNKNITKSIQNNTTLLENSISSNSETIENNNQKRQTFMDIKNKDLNLKSQILKRYSYIIKSSNDIIKDTATKNDLTFDNFKFSLKYISNIKFKNIKNNIYKIFLKIINYSIDEWPSDIKIIDSNNEAYEIGGLEYKKSIIIKFEFNEDHYPDNIITVDIIINKTEKKQLEVYYCKNENNYISLKKAVLK